MLQQPTEENPLVSITEAASRQIMTLVKGDERLRLLVQGGGCSGFQYGFQIDKRNVEEDYEVGGWVVIDYMSVQYLQGATIDWVEDLQGSYFKISNPNVKSTCGCGSSFSA
jgi:iron-sulfur cluster insertion protein